MGESAYEHGSRKRLLMWLAWAAVCMCGVEQRVGANFQDNFRHFLAVEEEGSEKWAAYKEPQVLDSWRAGEQCCGGNVQLLPRTNLFYQRAGSNPSCSTSDPVHCWCTGEAVEDGPKACNLATHVWDWMQSSALAWLLTAIWKVNQPVNESSLFLCFCISNK